MNQAILHVMRIGSVKSIYRHKSFSTLSQLIRAQPHIFFKGQKF